MIISRELIKRSFPFLAKSIHWCKLRANELPTIGRHLSRRRKQRKRVKSGADRIKVVFICQYIPAWSKCKALYEALSEDSRFELILLCVPNRIHSNTLDNPDDMSNDTFDYFFSHGYNNAVNALTGKNLWFDLHTVSPDYVIYNRFDRAMPTPYTSFVVSSYAKVCLLKYATVLLRAEESMMDQKFAVNTFMFFAENDGKRDEFLRITSLLHTLKLSSAICCGIPGVENAFRAKGSISNSWSFSQHSFRAIYAPRWTTDPVWGGSSFLKYKQTFFDIADSQPEVDILVRPHPLMFSNFINTGLMSAEEVEDYKKECDDRPNICLDPEKEYLATFWQSSVLVCDFSSMIIEYYVTKKPIVYLTYDEGIEYNELMSAMLKGCYIVNNEDELKQTLMMLLSGRDPLVSIRSAVCEKVLLQGDNVKASENMKRVLLEEYRN